MKSGVPWNVKGVRQQVRETAHEAARRSGMSVGEWLDSVIIDSAAVANVPDEGLADDTERYPDHDADEQPSSHRGSKPRWRRKYADYDQRHGQVREDGFAEVHDRLDTLSRQLDHVVRAGDRPGRATEPSRSRNLADAVARIDQRLDQLIAGMGSAAPAIGGRMGAEFRPLADLGQTRPRQILGADRPTPLDQALVEIAERQRVLDGDVMPGFAARADLPRAPTQGLPALEQQLRNVTAHIETMRPCGIENAVETLRDDLAEIGVMLKEAMPQRAVEALEREARALAERIDQQRHAGVDSTALAGLERGLAEVRDALRGLTPAESLGGFEQAVKGLTEKIDVLAASNQDPAALKQLEGAILALRGIVSHVASNDSLSKLSDEVRGLASKMDQVAGSGDMLSTLERRIATMADALQSRNHSGQDARDLEVVIKGLSDKIERLQLSRTDQAAVGNLEDRIAKLVEKLDASDARLNQLSTIERGLAELLIHLEHNRVPKVAAASAGPVVEVETLRRDVLKTQDSLEAIHGTVGQVVDRIAMIEGGVRGGQQTPAAVTRTPAPTAAPLEPGSAPAPATSPSPSPARSPKQAVALATTVQAEAAPAPSPNPAPAAAHERRPIDPDLPPDHPIEPGAVRGRGSASPADRIAASEAALGSAKPPVIPDPGGKSNFIAAARRAAKAAAREAPAPGDPRTPIAAGAPATRKLAAGVGKRVRSVLVMASVAIIVLGSLHVMVSLFGSSDAPDAESPVSPAQSPVRGEEQAAPSPSPNEAPSAAPTPPPGRQSMIVPGFDAMTFSMPRPKAAAPAEPAQQTATPAPRGDITSSVRPPAATSTNREAAPPVPPARPTAADKLPAAIGSGGLRAAAVRGDPAAEFEIAVRYAEGRGVPPNLTEAAAWFERAAKQNLAPAHFRLGGLYEKGLGVKKDLDAARRHYIVAAQAGNAKAMHNLAVLYAEGVDGKPDYAEAANWFRKASGHGTADSQYNLGILYARGIGVETNLAEAYKWFALAAREGDTDAAKKRDDVGARLDPQSLAAARLAAQNWVAEPQPEAAAQVKVPAGGWDGVPTPSQAGRRIGP